MTEPQRGTQNAAILDYLRTHDGITPLEALSACGVMRLAARIDELKRAGFGFEVETVKRAGKRFARYRLATPQLEIAL